MLLYESRSVDDKMIDDWYKNVCYHDFGEICKVIFDKHYILTRKLSYLHELTQNDKFDEHLADADSKALFQLCNFLCEILDDNGCFEV